MGGELFLTEEFESVDIRGVGEIENSHPNQRNNWYRQDPPINAKVSG